MYLSHPVRRMRDNPGEGDVTLVVELDTDLPDAESSFRRAVEEADGAVEEELGFDCWQVTVPETAIGALCDLDAVVRVETAATLDIGVDGDSTKTADDS